MSNVEGTGSSTSAARPAGWVRRIAGCGGDGWPRARRSVAGCLAFGPERGRQASAPLCEFDYDYYVELGSRRRALPHPRPARAASF